MADYIISLSKKAQKQLDKLSDLIAEPILDAIANLATNPRPAGCKKLKGRDGFRLRVGNYRILYDIYDTELVVDVIALGHRKEVYR
jgi:mRNA interferase RelE/StbE